MARLFAILLGASVAAVCLAVPRADWFDDEVVTTAKSVPVRKDAVDNVENPDHHRRHHHHHHRHEAEHFRRHNEDDDEIPVQHKPHYRHRIHRHFRHHRHNAHPFDHLIYHIVRKMALTSGLNMTDANKLVGILKVQIDANRVDLLQDRSNWTEPQFRAQFKRMEARTHGDFRKVANQQIDDKDHLNAFFFTADAQEQKFKQQIMEIQKVRLRRFATAANVSETNFERFISIVEANPVEVLPRKHMSIAERQRVLEAMGVEWNKIKSLTTQGMSDEDKKAMQVFFAAVETDFLQSFQREYNRRDQQYHHVQHFAGNRPHHDFHKRLGRFEDEEGCESRHHHRAHHRRHHYRDEEPLDEEEHHHDHHHHKRHHRHHHHHSDEDTVERHHHHDEDEHDEAEPRHRPRHHHAVRHHVKDHHRSHSDEDVDDDGENEIKTTRRPMHRRVHNHALRHNHQEISRDEE